MMPLVQISICQSVEISKQRDWILSSLYGVCGNASQTPVKFESVWKKWFNSNLVRPRISYSLREDLVPSCGCVWLKFTGSVAVLQTIICVSWWRWRWNGTGCNPMRRAYDCMSRWTKQWFNSWINKYIHTELWDVITNPCPPKLWHEWIFTPI